MEIVPTDKQQEFLASNADICLYSGGAGSGKSYAILIDSLGLNDEKFGPRVLLKHYRALIYRKQYSHLSDLIDKSKLLFKIACPTAIYNSSEMVWKFPSGAQIHFSYFDNFSDVDKIQGKEYAAIYCDELGQYPDDKVMRYTLSRLRSAHGLKCYFRATSNPSRYKWMRNTFRINSVGDSTCFYIDTDLGEGKKTRKKIQYIQAMLSDNPYLGDEYKSQLMLLPEDERNALLYGRWDAYDLVDGAIYKKELQKFYFEKRYTNIPFDSSHDYYAAFDLGRNDTTAIILFHMAGKEIQIFDYFENKDEDITFYIDWLTNNGYKDANIILPHDAKQKRIEFKNSVFQTVSNSFKSVKVLERIGIEEGIDCARRKFDHVYINKTKCERLIECLTMYRRKHNAALDIYTEPLHDGYSNGADAFRYACLVEPVEKFVFDFSNVGNTSTF